MVLNTEWAQVEVIDLINDGSGLAFGIIGGRSTGVVVKTILPGGVADRDGRLQSGDHILQIGEVNLRGLGSEQVASVLRQCGVHVRMVVARPIESSSPDYQSLGSQAPIVPTRILGDPVELDRHLIENGYPEAFSFQPIYNFESSNYIYADHHAGLRIHRVSSMDPVPVPFLTGAVVHETPSSIFAMAEANLPETETFTVEIKKDDLGLGITVAGYVCEKEEISGIFIKSISKGSAADLTKNIKVNDRIVEVNGLSVIGFTNHEAIELLRNSGPIVTIKLERYLRGPKYEQLQQAIKANELRPPSPPSPTLTSLPKVPASMVQMDYLMIDPEGESRTSFEFDSSILLEAMAPINEEKEIVIGSERKSFQFSISTPETIYEKWKNRLDKQVDIMIAQMRKDTNSGLGISLEGTVDVEDGKEVRPHHYIRNILPYGPVGQNGILQSGDELLEVNGIQLMGLNHLEVVSILKQLPNFVSLVCARYSVPSRIIDTSQHREAFQARKILAGSLQTLIPVNEINRLVKAKSESSIASSMASGTTPSRSRSLELIAGLPMWSEEPTLVELTKGEYGLGFSILDYQDPLNPKETVIVIRSLVPGGVAQNDGRLIPGDRLLQVNDINVEHATLDGAVQVLKGAPKGIVRISVAKPLNCVDQVSYTSQDTEDDQTCLEDFQECIEEFQECLEAVHICIDEENSFNHSPCTSQVEDFGQKRNCAQNGMNANFLDNNYLNVQNKNDIGDSDIDISFRSMNDAAFLDNDDKFSGQNNKNNVLTSRQMDFIKLDGGPSVTQSSLSEKDGYETCMDESLSEDNTKLNINRESNSNETEISQSHYQTVQNSNSNIENKLDLIVIANVPEQEDVTPTNSNVNVMDQFFLNVPDPNEKSSTPTVNVAVSEPCLTKDFLPNGLHLCLDTKMDDGLKSYEDHPEDPGGDEFFLIEYPDSRREVCKSVSEPNFLETYEVPMMCHTSKGRSFKRCLKEYYNDIAECLEAYEFISEAQYYNIEMSDDEIFNEIFLPFKSRSAPDILDRTFIMLTYDPGPDLGRRKSAVVPGHLRNDGEMTVIRPIDTEVRGCQVEEMLQKHWGATHSVKVYREPNKSLGISIVGGKVDLHSAEKSSDTFLGIFIKNVVPNSPAGKTGQFKTGDRILEVSGIDLRVASHEKAVQAIRNASNPVTFIIQSLIPWKISENDALSTNTTSACPSPCPSPASNKFPASTPLNEHFVKNQELLNTKSSIKKQPAPPVPIANKIQNDIANCAPTSLPQTAAQPITSSPEKAPIATTDESPEASDSEEDEDVREMEGRTVSAKGHQIDRASAANVKRTKDEVAADTEPEDDYGYTMSE